MKMSESIKNLAPALLKAQRTMGAAKKDSKNPFFKSTYSDYGSVLEVCKDPLNENNIMVLQPQTEKNGKNYVETILIHESGEWISGETEVVCAKQSDPQALGSAITYARRYGLQSLLSIPSEDDDGNKGSARELVSKPAMSKTVTTNTVVAATTPISNPATEVKPSSFKTTAAPVNNKAKESLGW